MDDIRPRVRFFSDQEDLHAWFETNHARAKELWIGYYKNNSGRKSVTYKEAVEEALCYGWIDGQVRSLDEQSYANRYTPRKPGSPWSKVNVAKAEQLSASGRMRPVGARAFAMRDAKHREGYSTEQRVSEFDALSLKTFKGDSVAWQFFRAQAPSYQKISTLWVMDARREETRHRRLAVLIEDSRRGRRINLLAPFSSK
jgi:uncharacterized protein YdeI (YjbR/CyaY-like superfamily)